MCPSVILRFWSSPCLPEYGLEDRSAKYTEERGRWRSLTTRITSRYISSLSPDEASWQVCNSDVHNCPLTAWVTCGTPGVGQPTRPCIVLDSSGPTDSRIGDSPMTTNPNVDVLRRISAKLWHYFVAGLHRRWGFLRSPSTALLYLTNCARKKSLRTLKTHPSHSHCQNIWTKSQPKMKPLSFALATLLASTAATIVDPSLKDVAGQDG